jgi:hypothetical protein
MAMDADDRSLAKGMAWIVAGIFAVGFTVDQIATWDEKDEPAYSTTYQPPTEEERRRYMIERLTEEVNKSARER